MVSYRPVTQLTDEEILFIVNDIFKPKLIENIVRDSENCCIMADITTVWNDEITDYECIDTITLYEPMSNSMLIEVDWGIDSDDILKWEQFCLSKGCYSLLKDNPYLEN